jgi:hypothetical protein
MTVLTPLLKKDMQEETHDISKINNRKAAPIKAKTLQLTATNLTSLTVATLATAAVFTVAFAAIFRWCCLCIFAYCRRILRLCKAFLKGAAFRNSGLDRKLRSYMSFDLDLISALAADFDMAAPEREPARCGWNFKYLFRAMRTAPSADSSA